jgi:aminoglycoside/choline kinase family phosphotransferase
MTTVTILPVPTKKGKRSYLAVAGKKQSVGKTAGAALDALTQQLTEREASTLVIIQNQLPDEFFGEEQQKQLASLMERWRESRDTGESLTEHEQTLLDQMIEAELLASANRTKDILNQLST